MCLFIYSTLYFYLFFIENNNAAFVPHSLCRKLFVCLLVFVLFCLFVLLMCQPFMVFPETHSEGGVTPNIDKIVTFTKEINTVN